MLEKHELQKHARNVRRNILTMVSTANSGHPGGSLSAVEIGTWLYFSEMDITADNIASNKRDRFVLSKGHASPLLYAILAEKGFVKEEELLQFRQLGSSLQGHPSKKHLAGVDMSTGSLGQGISTAVGMALANKIDQNSHRVFVLLGDGESEEGQVWEASMAAAHYKLDNLVVFVDANGLQIDGYCRDVMNPYPLDEKFCAFGWNVVVIDGHDYDEIRDALSNAKTCVGKPTAIIAKTIKGKGISFMENDASWHGTAPNAEQLKQALAELEEGAHE